MMVRMIIHSNRIHLENHTIPLLRKFEPDKRNRLEGNSALSASVIIFRFFGIFKLFLA